MYSLKIGKISITDTNTGTFSPQKCAFPTFPGPMKFSDRCWCVGTLLKYAKWNRRNWQLAKTWLIDAIRFQSNCLTNTAEAELSMGWVGSRFFSFWWVWVGSTTAKVLKIWKDYVNAFKARLDKIWLHQAVKFDFTANLTDTDKFCV